MLDKYSKSVKREILRLASLAYERELDRELGKLREQFRLWESRQLDAFHLSDFIHEFHNGCARELYSRYVRSPDLVDFWLARAVHQGLIRDDELSDRTLKALSSLLESAKKRAETDRKAIEENFSADEQSKSSS